MLLKVMSKETTELIYLKTIEDVSHGVDVVTDETYTFDIDDTAGFNKGDLCIIQEQNREYYYVITMIENNTSFSVKSFLEVFNFNILIEAGTHTLYQLLQDNFINCIWDPTRDIHWLNIDGIDNTIEYSIDEDTTLNAKDLFLKLIYGARQSFYVENLLNSNLIKLYTTTNAVKRVNIDLPGFTDINLPDIDTGVNTLDIKETVTEEYTFTDNTGTTQTGTRTKETNYYTYVLLNDNTISTDLTNSKRLLPAISTVSLITRADTEPSTVAATATNTLIDNSKYYITFSLHKNNKLYNLIDANIGDIFDLIKGGIYYRAVLTSIEVDGTKFTYKFGRTRIDLVYEIRKLKRGENRI